MGIGRRMAFTALGMFIPLVLAILVYIGYVWIGVANGTARTTGTIGGLGLRAPVTVIRDARGIPHIRAASVHDAAFAQGYVTGADRLYQIIQNLLDMGRIESGRARQRARVKASRRSGRYRKYRSLRTRSRGGTSRRAAPRCRA